MIDLSWNETWNELDKLNEWKSMSAPSKPTSTPEPAADHKVCLVALRDTYTDDFYVSAWWEDIDLSDPSKRSAVTNAYFSEICSRFTVQPDESQCVEVVEFECGDKEIVFLEHSGWQIQDETLLKLLTACKPIAETYIEDLVDEFAIKLVEEGSAPDEPAARDKLLSNSSLRKDVANRYVRRLIPEL